VGGPYVTPLWLALALPLVELAAYWHLRRKIAYQRYPALMVYLLSEAAWHLAGAFHYPIATRWAQPARMAVRAWVIFEVFRFACLRFNPQERVRLVGEAIWVSAACAWIVGLWTEMSPLENFFLFRGYFHLVLATALWWLVVRLARQEIAENRDHRAYRWGMVRWFSVLAVSGMFVTGGTGYWVFPFDQEVWWWANVVSYALLTINVAVTALSMTANVSCLRPDLVYGSVEKAFHSTRRHTI
jgi:hypothetical protein